MLWSLTVTSGKSAPWHAHEAFEFILCWRDGGQLALDQQEIPFRRGRTILVPPGLRHRYLFGPGETADAKVICLIPRDMASHLSPAVRSLADGMTVAGGTWADHSDDVEMLEHLATLIREGLGADSADESHVAWGAIGLLLACHGRRQQAAGNPSWRRHRDKMLQICRWLDEHLDEIVSLEEIAVRFGLSRSLLTREFRRHAGRSLVDYCNTRRVEKAAATLMSSPATITQAALESGFANLSHFHRQFKATYGLTPAAFRRQAAGQSDSRRGSRGSLGN